jgi:cell division protein FtsX
MSSQDGFSRVIDRFLGVQHMGLIKHDVVTMIKASAFKFFGVSLLIGCLLFLLNTLVAISYNVSEGTDQLKGRLGMYFYIKDDVTNKDQIYAQIMQLKDKLQGQGLTVNFSSKDDAFGFLKKTVPNLVSTFEKYNIENPLPATLYVMVKDESQYQTLKSTIINYKDIILNIQDVSDGKGIQDQENRLVQVFKLSDFVIGFSYFLIAILVAIIVVLMLFMIKTKFQQFYPKIELKKLLGATYEQITYPFAAFVLAMIGTGIVCMLVLTFVVFLFLNTYLWVLFDVSLILMAFSHIGSIFLLFIAETLVLGGISLAVSQTYVNKLLAKV